jgi:diacylglycerol kinase family enzyme
MTQPGDRPPASIPVLVNMHGGTAAAAAAALKAAGSQFVVRLIEPTRLAEEVRQAVASGAPRIAVAGGDGSIETAAAVLAGSPVELAIIPGGTLNHFARDHGIPLALSEAIEVAATGSAQSADVGVVNKRVFINTSSVGAYVVFVRVRNRLRPLLGYHLASLVGGIRILTRMRRFSVHLTMAGEDRVYETPLLFVGVGERSLAPPQFGGRVPGGKRTLHVMVVGRPREARRWISAYNRAFRVGSGGEAASERKGPLLDALLVDACRVELSRRRGNVAVDGDIAPLMAPLGYRLWRDALQVVRPRASGEE